MGVGAFLDSYTGKPAIAEIKVTTNHINPLSPDYMCFLNIPTMTLATPSLPARKEGGAMEIEVVVKRGSYHTNCNSSSFWCNFYFKEK